MSAAQTNPDGEPRVFEQMTRLLLGGLASAAAAPGADRMLLELLLRDGARERATDIHLDPRRGGTRVRLRIDGELYDAGFIAPDQAARLVNQIKAAARIDPVACFVPVESRFTADLDNQPLDVRLTVTPCLGGEKLAIRLLDPRRLVHFLHDLGLDSAGQQLIEQWVHAVSGMVLVSGPSGCGKTTTLYALLRELKAERRNTLTIEDPIEYRIEGITQVQVDEHRGLSFARGLKSMLRLDADYLMLGEVRDAETAHVAVNASMTGRVLLSTLHSANCVGVITALRNWGVSDREIATALSVVMAQRLVRMLCPKCRRQGPPTESDIGWLVSAGVAAPPQVWQAAGCPACQGQGYFGRTGIFEVWLLDERDHATILSGADEHTLRQHFHERTDGRTLLRDALAKAAEGVTSLDELRRIPQLMTDLPARPGPGAGRPRRRRRAALKTQGSGAGVAGDGAVGA